MGWQREELSRDEIVKRHAGPWPPEGSGSTIKVTAVRQHRSWDEDWFLFEAVGLEGELVDRWIQVMIWSNGYHKEIDEASGPYYYGCPPEWFDSVPVPKNSPHAARWRRKVGRAILKRLIFGFGPPKKHPYADADTNVDGVTEKPSSGDPWSTWDFAHSGHISYCKIPKNGYRP